MTAPERQGSIAEGKTKAISPWGDTMEFVRVRNKDDITAFNDPAFTQRMDRKAVYATTTTCRVFELLHSAGIPVAYFQRLSSTEFIAHRCRMIPVEAVARRFAVGSYIKRYPGLAQPGDPIRLRPLVTEFFLKTTAGRLVMPDGSILVDGLEAKEEDDPLILDPALAQWFLYHPKKPIEQGSLGLHVNRGDVLGRNDVAEARFLVRQMDELLLRTFLVLEGAWMALEHTLIDLKIEFGFDREGRLRVADVIDNDSWRLRKGQSNGTELSKEAYRQGLALDVVSDRYSHAAQLVEQFPALVQGPPRSVLSDPRIYMRETFEQEGRTLI